MRAAAESTTAVAAATIGLLGGPGGELGQHLFAGRAAGLDEEPVLALEDLGQREVVALLDARAGVHRDAEARGGGLAAVDGDDEDPAAPGGVVAVDELAAGEDAGPGSRSRSARRRGRR